MGEGVTGETHTMKTLVRAKPTTNMRRMPRVRQRPWAELPILPLY